MKPLSRGFSNIPPTERNATITSPIPIEFERQCGKSFRKQGFGPKSKRPHISLISSRNLRAEDVEF